MILAITTILVTVAISSTALAQGPPSQQGNQIDIIIGLLTNSIFGLEEIKDEVRDILGNVTSPLFGLEEIKNEVEAIEEKLDSETTGLGAIKGVIDTIDTEVGAIETKLDGETSGLAAIKGAIDTVDTEVDAIEAKLDNSDFGLEEIDNEVEAIEAKLDSGTTGLAAIKASQYVPFKVRTTADKTCDVADAGSTPSLMFITINSAATSGDFMVTGVKVNVDGLDAASDSIKTRSALQDSQGGSSVSDDLTGSHSTNGFTFDVMGTTLTSGAKFPTQLAAQSIGDSDISIVLTCNAGTTSDITFGAQSIIVSGWKQVDDTITVT